jgi:protoheme IX farnesyltransferase
MTDVHGLLPQTLRVKVATYWTFSKPRIWIAFALEALVGSLLAWSASGAFPWVVVMVGIMAIVLAAAGAEALTNVLDRAMDAVMQRTRTRPLPSGTITPTAAVVFGLVCVGASLGLGGFLGPIPLMFLVLGLIDNVVIYSALTKRTTPWSIVLGAGSGAVPVWVGFSALRLPISLSAWLLGVVVMCWIPVHIWSLAWAYREDYARADVPMAPVVWAPRTFQRAWYGALILMMAATVTFSAVALPSIPAVIVDGGVGWVALLGLQWGARPTLERARKVFMGVNLYLVGLLVLVIVVRL